MNIRVAESTGRVERLFRALADRTRLRILHVLLHGEFCVGDLIAALQMSQPKVSRHLAYLRRAGLVARRKQGLWCFYALRPPRSALHRRLIDCVRDCAVVIPALGEDAGRVEEIHRSGGCCPAEEKEVP